MIDLEPVSKFCKQKYSLNKNERKKQKKKGKDREIPHTDIEVQPEELDQKLNYMVPYENRQFENSYITRFIHEKTLMVASSVMFCAVLSMVFSLVSSPVKHYPFSDRLLLIAQSLITLVLEILIVVSFILKEQLAAAQLIQRQKQHQILLFLRENLVKMIVILPHPNYLFQGIVVQMEEPTYGQLIPQQINNVLQILMMLRIYLIYDAAINSSMFSTTRASRICRIYSTKCNTMFGIKSIFNSNPLAMLVTLFSTLVIMFAQMLKISEQEINVDLSSFGNSAWCVIITMGTIGYGDYNPKTYIGRVIVFMAAISGIIISSLLILTLSTYLSMSVCQKKSHLTLLRLELQSCLAQYCQDTVLETTMARNGAKNEVMEKLKKKAERVKFTLRRIKNMVDNENLNEEINALFEALRENMLEIYLNQEKHANLLNELYTMESRHIDQIKFSLATEIENIIKDR